MRGIVVVLMLVGLSSCGPLLKGTITGKGNINGSLLYTYQVAGGEEIKLTSSSTVAYPYELVNKSDEDITIVVNSAEGKGKTLKKEESFVVSQGVLQGIRIRNTSQRTGSILLKVTLKNQNLEVPKAEIVTK